MSKLLRDGVTLAYEEAGSGAPSMLFVHGFIGNRSHFSPQIEYFRQTHRVVAVDRRGHGESDKPEEPYTIEGSSDDLAWLCEQLGLYQPVVVVHSQDVIAFDLVSRYPDLAAALVIIDGPTFPPPELATAFQGLLQGLRSPQYLAAIQQLLDTAVFLPTDPGEVKALVLEGAKAMPQHVIVSTWEAFLGYDLAEAASRCTIPLLYIKSHFPSNLDRLREVCPQAVVGQTAGAGHFSPLVVPEQVNAMIDRFLAVTQIPEEVPTSR